MELRHLRYFIAIVEEGSLTVAAERRLHTAQPSLSRQIRDLEDEVGVRLLTRTARGVRPTAAGLAFLDHARLALAQVQAAGDAARRAARPAKPSFALGFLTGQEMDWLPAAMRILQDELPNLDISVSSQYSPELAQALVHGRLDLAFMRPEPGLPALEYRRVSTEPLVVLMSSDHPLAAHDAVEPTQLVGPPFINVSDTAPALRAVIDRYLRASGLSIESRHQVDNISMAISLVASTKGLALLPRYVMNFLPASVVARPLARDAPTIDLVVGFNPSNTSATLSLFLSRIGEMSAASATASASAG